MIVTIFFCAGITFGVEIVYPKTENSVINSPVTFFIGNEKKYSDLKINNEQVKIHPSGGFKHVVDLNYGMNKFVINTGGKSKIYNIFRPLSKENEQTALVLNYEKSLTAIVNSDNVPLRSTPSAESSFNRLQHLPQGVWLNAVGEYEDFYKVQLARDDYAWVEKNYVELLNCDCQYWETSVINQSFEENDNSLIYKFKLTNKVPFVLSETNNGFDLVIYGLDNKKYNFGKYEFFISYANKKLGYKIYYNNENELTVEIKKDKVKLKDLIITIDAGHGGSEYGAIGCLGTREKDVNLVIAKKIETYLKSLGVETYLTRNSDVNMGLYERVEFTNRKHSDIFISIHSNAVPDYLAKQNVSGTTVYYYYPQAKKLAQNLVNLISQNTNLVNNGAKSGSFAVIRNTEAVSVLIEVAFLITPEDNVILLNNDFQNLVVKSVINALENYVNDL